MNMCKISRVLRPSTEAVTGKKPGSDSPDDLREPPQETGGNQDSPGDIIAGGCQFGQFFFYHKDTGAGKHHSVVLLLLYQFQELIHSSVDWHKSCDLLGQAVSPTGTQHHLQPVGTSSETPSHHNLGSCSSYKQVGTRIGSPGPHSQSYKDKALPIRGSMQQDQGQPCLPATPRQSAQPQQKGPNSPHRGHPQSTQLW